MRTARQDQGPQVPARRLGVFPLLCPHTQEWTVGTLYNRWISRRANVEQNVSYASPVQTARA